MLVFLNGKFVPRSRALVSIFDHGFLYGDGVYETIRVFGGRPFLLEDHFIRLAQSAQAIRLKIPCSFRQIEEAIRQLIKRNREKNCSIRLTLTRGPGPYGFDPRPCRHPTLAIVSNPFPGYPADFYRKGIKAAVVEIRRNHPRCLPPTVKSTSCLNGILAKIESLELGAQEGIFLTLDGRLAEGTVSNVFLVKNGKLLTPSLGSNFLPGVTRVYVCAMARRLGLRVLEKDLRFNDLKTADEVFLTSTLMNIMPVTRIVWREGKRKKEIPVGVAPSKKGQVGEVTRSLSLCFEKGAVVHSSHF